MKQMPKRDLKKTIASKPVLGYSAKVVRNIVKSPKIQEQLSQNLHELTQLIVQMQESQDKQANEFNKLVGVLTDKISSLQTQQDDVQYQLNNMAQSQPNTKDKKAVKQADKELFAEDHLLDNFYLQFEDRHRGSEEMITERLKEHLPLFKESSLDFKKTPVLDIGSGRGEWIQLLRQEEVKSIGLDINSDMVERSKKKGLEAVQGDAIDFLQEAASQSYGAITGFHIVEHIPFNALLRLFKNAHRALINNGFVLFETPNPENTVVGSCAFYMDPSHLHPLPPDLLAFALETSGFRNIEIRRIHPVDVTEEETKSLPREIINRFYGPRDYAVIGYK